MEENDYNYDLHECTCGAVNATENCPHCHRKVPLQLPEDSKFTQDPKENRRIWIEALRSGKYKQGYGSLRTKDGFCCLGVACDLYSPSTWRETQDSFKTYRFQNFGSMLPSKVRDALGIHESQPEVKYHCPRVPVSKVNDLGTPFSRIADILEEWNENYE